jgi:ATP-binding cassette subfamily B protein
MWPPPRNFMKTMSSRGRWHSTSSWAAAGHLVPEDLEEADRVCRGLGLGDLLDRMPAGLFQMVGETGWQLSHGERSRLYIARALLQRADLVILDESFGQIDPESLLECLRYVSDRGRTLLVVTQP